MRQSSSGRSPIRRGWGPPYATLHHRSTYLTLYFTVSYLGTITLHPAGSCAYPSALLELITRPSPRPKAAGNGGPTGASAPWGESRLRGEADDEASAEAVRVAQVLARARQLTP